MSTSPLQLLLIEDSPSDVYLIETLLRRASARQVEVVHEAYLGAGLQHLQNSQFDVLLLDLSLPDSQGLETFVTAQTQASDLPIVVLTGFNDRAFALEAMRAGAQDYIAKEELTGHLLDRTISYAIERKQHEHEREELLQAKRAHQQFTETLERLGLVFSANWSLTNLLELICREAVIFFEAAASVVWLVQGEAIFCFAGYGEGKDRFVGNQNLLIATNEIVTKTILDKQPLIVTRSKEQGRDEGRDEVSVSWESEAYQGYETIACIPLARDERAIGVLMILYTRPMRAMQAQDLAVAMTLSSHSATIIENARLLGEVQSQARQIRKLLDTVPEGVVLLDPRFQVVLTNRLADDYLSQLGTSSAEVITELGGYPLHKLVRTNQVEPWQEIVTDAHPPRTFEMALQPIYEEQEDSGWLLVMRDVTDKRQRQALFDKQERLALVGRMAAGIAHDFNNILSVISLYTQLIQNDPPLPKREQYLNTIRDQTKSAANLVKQILDFSRRSSMQYVPLDLALMLEGIAQLLSTMLPENIIVANSYEPGAYWVRADRSHLEQAIMNFSLNARDAMPQGGELRFALRMLAIEQGAVTPLPRMEAGMWVVLSITDTGTGIPLELIPHIFEPFFTTKAVGKGSGLGLAQVYGIIKQHGGEVAVSSQVGKGTTFTVYLPALSEEEASSQAPDLIDSMQRGDGTILVIEDEPAVLQALSTFLEMLGYHVLSATNGDEGIAIFEQNGTKIDLVLSDIMMPLKTGIEVYHELKAKYPALKMILATGYPLEDDGKSLLEQGVRALVQKPYSLGTIAQEIHAVLYSAS